MSSLLSDAADDYRDFPLYQLGELIFCLPGGVGEGEAITFVVSGIRQVGMAHLKQGLFRLTGRGGRIRSRWKTGKGKYPQRLLSLLRQVIVFPMGGAEQQQQQHFQRRWRRRRTVSVELGGRLRPPPSPARISRLSDRFMRRHVCQEVGISPPPSHIFQRR